MLAPGFRFHPTDEELVRYYLRRKVCGKPFRFQAISDIDIYKAEPWDLPSFSKLKTKDLEWYFFSPLDKKYGNGSRTNRATERGYWKTTGKDRAVCHKSQIVGMKKTLVYHTGRAPKGQRTNWVMHEYRLTDLELEKAGIAQDAFVLCRVFQKSGSGPKNGEQYGAPFVEEEWEDDELEPVPTIENSEITDVDGDGFLDANDLEQILGSDDPLFDYSLPLSISPVDGGFVKATSESGDQCCKLMVNVDKLQLETQLHDDENLDAFIGESGVGAVKHQFVGESSKSANYDDWESLLDGALLDDIPYGGGFLEEGNVPNPSESNASALDMLEYLTFWDATDEDVFREQVLLPPEDTKGGNEVTSSSLPCELIHNPSDELETATHGSDSQSLLVKQATKILGSLAAPPAFASELPSGLHLKLLSPSQPPMTAGGTIQIRNLTVGGGYGKQDKFSIVFSLGFSRGRDGSATVESSLSVLPDKTTAAISRCWFFFACFWVLLLSISFKLGAYVCS